MEEKEKEVPSRPPKGASPECKVAWLKARVEKFVQDGGKLVRGTWMTYDGATCALGAAFYDAKPNVRMAAVEALGERFCYGVVNAFERVEQRASDWVAAAAVEHPSDDPLVVGAKAGRDIGAWADANGLFDDAEKKTLKQSLTDAGFFEKQNPIILGKGKW